MKNIVVFGATSAIVHDVDRLWAQEKAKFLLFGRDASKLSDIAKDLEVRGAAIQGAIAADFDDLKKLEILVAEHKSFIKESDLVFIGYGALGDQEEGESSPHAAVKVFHTNYVSPSFLILKITKIWEEDVKKLPKTLAVITSVAGDRGRPTNYIYGSSKAGLSAFLGGLRGKMIPQNVTILDIRPGFVDTPMIAHFKRNFLWASPENVAKDIYRAIQRKCNGTLYTPWFWRWIMLTVRMIPTKIFIKMRM